MTYMEQIIEQIRLLINEYGFQTAAWVLGEMLNVTTETAKLVMWTLGF